MKDYGLPEPQHLIGEAHPTLSSELPQLVRAGAISMRPGIREAHANRVTFDDGRSDDVDAIVFATGYRVTFPFFDPAHVSAPNNELPLFRRVFHPEHRHVFFVGLAQPHGAIMPIAELQAAWIAQHLTGRYSLPEQTELLSDITNEDRVRAARYVASARHTMQIDPEIYVSEVRREMRRGAQRAARQSGMAFRSGPREP